MFAGSATLGRPAILAVHIMCQISTVTMKVTITTTLVGAGILELDTGASNLIYYQNNYCCKP